jgi:hypothetical protein
MIRTSAVAASSISSAARTSRTSVRCRSSIHAVRVPFEAVRSSVAISASARRLAAFLQAADDVQLAVAIGVLARGERTPYLSVARVSAIRGHHADHRVWRAIDRDGPSENRPGRRKTCAAIAGCQG